MPRVLYIVYWGALEQLGQSLVIPAVKKLAQKGVDLTLITFEKPHDLARADEMERVRAILAKDKIDWLPLKYHKDPKIPATIFDISHGVARGLKKRLTKHFDVIHARTYIGGLIGLVLAPVIRAKFVYHNEGFYPDEQVDSSIWRKDSRPHQIAKRLENLMYSHASGIITLSHRAKEIIENLPDVLNKKTPVIFVPSCVDLERFHLPNEKSKFLDNEITLVYVGSVGGRYILNKIGSFVAAAHHVNPKIKLQIYSKADFDLVSKMLDQGGLSRDIWTLESIPYNEMPNRLANCHIALHFLQKGISEHSGSPTKIGEYWAVGLPVVITSNMSDMDEIIHHKQVGVIIKEHTENCYLDAFRKLQQLILDPELATRCRQVAESYYALNPACERQYELYKKISLI